MAGVNAFGTVLTVGSAIAELTNIGGPGLSAETIDVTSHDSTDAWREFVGGLKDGGEITVDGNFTTAAAANTLIILLGVLTSGATIVFPTTPATTWTFDCIVTGYETTAPMEDKLSFTATLKVSGKPVLTAAVA